MTEKNQGTPGGGIEPPKRPPGEIDVGIDDIFGRLSGLRSERKPGGLRAGRYIGRYPDRSGGKKRSFQELSTIELTHDAVC